jgi:D-3-phosphoglycerate dehydrogenase
MKKVLIPTKLDKFAAKILLDKGFNVVLDAETPFDVLTEKNSDAEVLIVRSEKVTQKIIDALPQLRLVVRAGAGYDTIDTKYARRKNIDVMNTPGANSNAVAEEVVAMMLAVSRFVVEGDMTTRAGLWEKNRMLGSELTGKTIGILGLGNIGRLLVKRLAGFEMRFLGYDPMLAPAMAEKLGVELCSVEKIFAESDFISLHIPENSETKGMVNQKLFATMKSGAVLVNCARSGVINEDDLREAKKNKKIIFATDVYPKDEPGVKPVADIADLMLPHLGANTKEANLEAAKRAATQTIEYFEQGITNSVVNKGIPDGLDASYQRLAFALAGLVRNYLGRDVNPTRIETSFYGELRQYAKWMTSPITAGIAAEFDPFLDFSEAEKFLKGRGIELVNRETDETKHYGEAMTIDLLAGENRISARGTITENNLMVSRVNDYDKLYLEPSGYNLFVEYSDAPGVIGKIASILGEKKINIIDIRAPQDLKTGCSLAVIKTNVEVPKELIEKISVQVKAIVAFDFSCLS